MAKCKNCGKFGLTLKLNADGKCKECELTAQLSEMQSQVDELSTPEYRDITIVRNQLKILNEQKVELENMISRKSKEIDDIDTDIKSKRAELITINGNLHMQSFGLYEPDFEFLKIDEYKAKLSDVRDRQKTLIHNDHAVSGCQDWQVNGNSAQGKKLVNDMKKLLLRTFNGECDELVAKVKYNNLDASIKRINASCDAISKLGKIMNIVITQRYKELKIEELKIAYEYAQAKQREKEELKAHREQMREEAKLLKEIEAQRQKLLKEQTHYANAMAKIQMQLSQNPDDVDLKAKLEELTAQYNETEKAIKDVDYREANKKAGYVYIISNIGSFGENVYKIGMTRRLDPQDRIDELSDASVPFNFDVHAMIFTDDAPGLEAALHNAFEDRKLNLINHRREFFKVTLDEIKEVVKKNYDKTVEFIEFPDAEQYRMSQNILKQRQ